MNRTMIIMDEMGEGRLPDVDSHRVVHNLDLDKPSASLLYKDTEATSVSEVKRLATPPTCKAARICP